MFLAHFGVGFAAKAAAPRISLGTIFLAAQFIDLLWPTLLQLGIERVNILRDGTRTPPLEFIHYPFSHSLLMVFVWAGLFAAAHYGFRRNRSGAFVLALAVISHWLLDLVVHYPDLPLYPGDSPLLGFALWSSPLIALATELLLFGMAIRLYLRSTRATDTTGTWALWTLVALLAIIGLGNAFGSPPPSVIALAWVGQAQWLLVGWGYWVDRHRTSGR